MCQVEKPPEKVGCEELESQEPNHAAKLWRGFISTREVKMKASETAQKWDCDAVINEKNSS